MKAAIYARVSTDEQAKKYSVPAQPELLRASVWDYAPLNKEIR